MKHEDSINLNDHFVRVPNMLTSEVDEDLVMLSIENGKYFGMNKVGKWIWHMLEKPTQLSDVCFQLLAQFDVETGQCEQEVVSFVSRLREQNLVTRCGF